MWLFLALLVSLTSYALEFPDKCDFKYRKCLFDCTNQYLSDKNKRQGCELRCKLNRSWCKADKSIDKITKDLKSFLEGFSKEK